MTRLLLIGLAMTLSACDGAKVEKKDASPDEVAQAVTRAGQDLKFTPGRWESSVTFVSMEAPGMPAGVGEAMQGKLGDDRRYATCLTKQAAEKPATDFFAKDARDCTYDHFTMGGGKIDARMRCGAKGGAGARGAVAMAMNGTYDPTHYDMAMETRIEAGGQGPMTMKMKVASARVGDCRGDEDGTSGADVSRGANQ